MNFPVNFCIAEFERSRLDDGKFIVASLKYERLHICNIFCVLGHEALTRSIRKCLLEASQNCSADALKSRVLQEIQPKIGKH